MDGWRAVLLGFLGSWAAMLGLGWCVQGSVLGVPCTAVYTCCARAHCACRTARHFTTPLLQEYKPHFDYFFDQVNGETNGGNRLATILMYLEEPELGGETGAV